MKRKSNKTVSQEHFFNYPTSTLRVRELERATNLPLPSITRYVKELIREGIVQKKVFGTTTFYTANRADERYRSQKILHNLNALFESQLIQYLREHYHNAPIRLFGSYSRGEDTEDSDIDIYVQTPLPPVSLSTFEKKLKRTVQLFTYKDIHAIPNKELANNIINGVPLNGHIEVIR